MSTQSNIGKNPYLDDPGLLGLLENLACGGFGGKVGVTAQALSLMSDERLAAIGQQAGNVAEDTADNLGSLGRVLALAAHTGETDSQDLADVGWLIAMLADLVLCMSSIKSDAAFYKGNAASKASAHAILVKEAQDAHS